MKTEKEIKEVIEDSKIGMEECDPDDSLIYQGWIEALEWVLKFESTPREEVPWQAKI